MASAQKNGMSIEAEASKHRPPTMIPVPFVRYTAATAAVGSAGSSGGRKCISGHMPTKRSAVDAMPIHAHTSCAFVFKRLLPVVFDTVVAAATALGAGAATTTSSA